MARLPAFTALLLARAVGPALADNDCNDPVATWKTREQVRLLFEQNGRTVQRIKVDDGCYEVRGLDRSGNRIKAKGLQGLARFDQDDGFACLRLR